MTGLHTAERAGTYDFGLPRLGLGLGMDLPWGERIGFTEGADGSGDITPRMHRFFEQRGADFAYSFFAFQPRDRGALDAGRYTTAYDRLYDALPPGLPRVLHHTMLNMGSPEPYAKQEIAAFTNDLVQRYGFQWIIEDLGIWSFRGKPLPYPLPPFLTDEGLRACVSHIREWRSLLDAPLSVEFPGFTEGGTFVIGTADAFRFFDTVIREADVYTTIDVGHILSYQWLRGRTGPDRYDGIDDLPLDRCVELHLSGCQIVNGRFRDLHHGVLLDEQLEMLDYLLPRCPRLVGVTYEDPVYDESGALVPKSIPNYLRLKERVDAWHAVGHGRGAST